MAWRGQERAGVPGRVPAESTSRTGGEVAGQPEFRDGRRDFACDDAKWDLGVGHESL